MTDTGGDEAAGSANLDLLSGDIVSDGTRVTAVIRVAKLAASDDSAPLGRSYRLEFNDPSRDLPLYLIATESPTAGQIFEYGEFTGTTLTRMGIGTGAIDLGRSEVRISAPAAFDGTVRLTRGKKLTGIRVFSLRRTGPVVSTADSSPSERAGSYIVGTPSCVRN
ncbi:MAG TPA: hypothetical protein VNA30_05625 [Mycobacteriales bacterium]|nr:hypothetical protein [Mycobacteriales bacterium]